MYLINKKQSNLKVLTVQLVVLLVFCGLSNVSLKASHYFNFDYVNKELGLGSGNIEVIVQDPDDFIWFGTHDGIFKYDGLYSQQFIRDGKPGSLLGADIYDLLITHDNTLWAATSSAGIARFDSMTNTFTHISDDTQPHSISHYRARKLLEFNNKIWILTDNGIETLDPVTFENEQISLQAKDGQSIKQYVAIDMLIHADAILTIYQNRLYRLNVDLMQFEYYQLPGYQHYAYSSDLEHYNIFSNSENKLFIYSEEGVFYVDKEHKTIRREPLKNTKDKKSRMLIRDIFVDSHNTVWVITLGQGMYYRFATDDFYSQVPHGIGANQLNTMHLYTMFEDRTNNLWLGTDGSFAAKFRAPQDLFPFYSNYYHKDNSFHTYSIWAFLEYAGQFFLGTDTGVFTYDAKQRHTQIKPLLTSARYRNTYALMPVKDSLYIGAKNGLFEYMSSGVVNDITHYVTDNLNSEAREDPSVLQLAQSDSQIFIGTFFGLLVIDKETQKTKIYNTESSVSALKDDWVLVMEYQEKEDLLWLGSPKGVQVISLNDDLSLTEVNRVLDQVPDFVNDFHFDDSGHVWIASNLGLYRYTPENVLLAYNDFPDTNIRSLKIIDDVIWMTVGNGMIRASVENIENYQYFTEEDGLYNTGFTQASAYYSESTDHLFFGGDKGFAAFSPDIRLPVSKPFAPHLSSINLVNADGVPDITQKVLQQKTLEYFENSLRFNFAYLDFKAPKKNRFQFKLDGFDNNWSALTTENAATYTNLSSADYVFRVKAYDANNVLSERELSVEFTIKTAWWKTEIAIFVYLLFLLLLTVYFWYWLKKLQERIKRQQIQRNKEEFINGYNRYALSLTELHSYQTLIRKFLDQVQLITGAKFLRYQQFLNEAPLEITIGDLETGDEYELLKLELMSNQSLAQLTLNEVTPVELAEATADIQILFQQMIILQATFLDRQKYNWNDNFSSITGLFNKSAFVKILLDEFTRAKRNSTSVVFFEWFIDKSRFRDNELLKRIQLLSYGDQIKYIFGHHVIATYLESDDSEPRFLIFLSELNKSISDQFEASLLKVIHENSNAHEEDVEGNSERVLVTRLHEGFDEFLDNLQ